MFTCNMAANNKTQMVFSHDNSIIVSNDQQPTVTSARQPSLKSVKKKLRAMSPRPTSVSKTVSTFVKQMLHSIYLSTRPSSVSVRSLSQGYQALALRPKFLALVLKVMALAVKVLASALASRRWHWPCLGLQGQRIGGLMNWGHPTSFGPKPEQHQRNKSSASAGLPNRDAAHDLYLFQTAILTVVLHGGAYSWRARDGREFSKSNTPPPWKVSLSVDRSGSASTTK